MRSMSGEDDAVPVLMVIFGAICLLVGIFGILPKELHGYNPFIIGAGIVLLVFGMWFFSGSG